MQGYKGSPHHLRLPSTLNQRLPVCIFGNSLNVIGKSTGQTRQAKEPEYQTDGQCEAFLNARRLGFEMKGYDDCDADDGHVDAQAKPGEEGTLIGAVVAGIGRVVGKEEGGKEGPSCEGGVGGVTGGVNRPSLQKRKRRWVYSRVNCDRPHTPGVKKGSHAWGGRKNR